MVSTDRHTDRQTQRDTDRHRQRQKDRQTDRRHAKNEFFGISMPQNVEIHQNLEIDFLDQCNTFSILRIVEKVKICFVRRHKTYSMCSVSRYNSKMAQDIEKCYITKKLRLFIFNNFCLKKSFLQRIFKALFIKIPNCAIWAEATPVARSKKNLDQKLRIAICYNFYLKKILYKEFLRHFSPKK